MGTNCAPLVADLFLYCYERDFMDSLNHDNQADVIEAFNSTSRHLDDLLNIDNPYFEGMVNQIYPSELQLNKANISDTEAPLKIYISLLHRRHYELISKYNVGLKTLLSEGLSEPEFYGDVFYKFRKLIGSNDFSFQFRKIITRYRRIRYDLNVMRQSACLVFNPIMVDNYAAFFNCTPVCRASDSKMTTT